MTRNVDRQPTTLYVPSAISNTPAILNTDKIFRRIFVSRTFSIYSETTYASYMSIFSPNPGTHQKEKFS